MMKMVVVLNVLVGVSLRVQETVMVVVATIAMVSVVETAGLTVSLNTRAKIGKAPFAACLKNSRRDWSSSFFSFFFIMN